MKGSHYVSDLNKQQVTHKFVYDDNINKISSSVCFDRNIYNSKDMILKALITSTPAEFSTQFEMNT